MSDSVCRARASPTRSSRPRAGLQPSGPAGWPHTA
jgi:hypothetical protein